MNPHNSKKSPVDLVNQQGITLSIDQICIHNFNGTVANVVHALYPEQLILRFELFRYDVFLAKLLDQTRIHFFRKFVDIGEMSVEFALSQEVVIEDPVVFFEVASAALSPDADWSVVVLRGSKAGEIIIPLQLITDTGFVVSKCAFHNVPTFLLACALDAEFDCV